MSFKLSIKAVFVLGTVLLCGACQPKATGPQEAFFDKLSEHCGKAYAGQLVSKDEVDADFAGKKMVMHVRECSGTELRIPFHVDDDHSRTWVITKTENGLRLKHDHRHEDGSEDAVTQYGGDTIYEGAKSRQVFPVDQFSIDMFLREGLDVSIVNVWAVEINEAFFAYELSRPNRHFRVEFDVTTPVETPPAPWGFDDPVRIPLKQLNNTKAEVSYTHQKLKNGNGRTGKIRGLLEIKSSNDEGFIASWTSKSVEVNGVLIDESSPQAGSMFLGLPLDFLTGTDGGPIKLLDREKLLEELPNSAAFANSDAKTIEQVTSYFKSMDDDTIANVFLKVPSFMSVCQDTNFVLGEANNFSSEQASPFGEGVLIGNVSYKLTSVDTKNNTASIEYRTEFDKESVTQLAIESIKKLAPDAPISQKEIDEIVVERNDSADCKVDLSTGWVTDIVYSTIVSASGETNEEVFDVSLNWMK